MSTDSNDYYRDMAIDELHHEELMRAATKAQCIYLFVEGASEEQAFPILLERAGLDLEKLGIEIVNYSGIGNLGVALTLLGKTLSRDRPVIVTYDNDKVGKKDSALHVKMAAENVTFFPIPCSPVVTYGCGHQGGSFEEAFDPKDYVEACFNSRFFTETDPLGRDIFDGQFDKKRPWHSQINIFCINRYGKPFSQSKPALSVELAENVEKVPETFLQLASLLQCLRENHPVRNPNDVELPKIRGLTC